MLSAIKKWRDRRRGLVDKPASGLVVSGLSKSYNRRKVVKSVDLQMAQGEAIGLLGPNGAGKTTCFYMITGLLKPDKGAILLDDRDITRLPMYRRAQLGIGYLPQEASVFRGLTVEQNILAVLEICESSAKVRRRKLDGLLEEFGLTHLRKSLAISLSGGERRRTEIARVLASEPRFILLDEPLAGIDPINVADIRALVGTLKERNLGVLITDHNVRDTLDLIDRAYILHDGHVLLEGSPEAIIADKKVREVYLGEDFKL